MFDARGKELVDLLLLMTSDGQKESWENVSAVREDWG